MSWRGQGGRRAKGRRGDQDPELDNTAWLAELEREAAQADDDEDDWASSLRGRRSPATPPEPVAPAPDPGWPPADPEPAGRSTQIVVVSRNVTSRPYSPARVAWMTSFWTSP